MIDAFGNDLYQLTESEGSPEPPFAGEDQALRVVFGGRVA
jgi:hypothetical protein